jgi:peptidoglycan hydrolase-like protein with peptidoglycan-binding domain
MDVQSALEQHGYDPGPGDGVLGPETREAIAKFQKEHGLPRTGRIDGRLLDAL